MAPGTGLHRPLPRGLARELAGLGSDTRWLFFFFFLKSLGWVEIKAVRNEFFSLEILNCLFFGRGWGLGSITSQNVRAFGSLASISPQVSRRLSQHLASEMITVQLSLRRWSTPGFVCSKHIIRFLRREL